MDSILEIYGFKRRQVMMEPPKIYVREDDVLPDLYLWIDEMGVKKDIGEMVRCSFLEKTYPINRESIFFSNVYFPKADIEFVVQAYLDSVRDGLRFDGKYVRI